MSSSAEEIRAVHPRPARLPWAVLAAFLAVVAVGMVFVNANGEPLDQQVPYIVAFAMFGVVGALIVSRDRRNTIGILFLWASFLTASSFLGGELFTYAVVHGQSGWWLAALGLLNNFGWLFGIFPVVFLTPLLFPDGHLPTPRWRSFLWFSVAFVAVIGIDLALGQKSLSGSMESITIANPLYIAAVGKFPSLDPLIAVFFAGIFAASVVSLILRFRRSTGVERQQIKWVVFGFGVALVGITATTFNNQETIVTALDRWRRVPAAAALHRYRDPALPSLRPGRRGAQDPYLRRLRALRHADLPGGRGRRRRLVGTRQLVPHHGGGRGRGAHVPAGASAAHAVRQPIGVREAGDAVRGAVRILRTRRRSLCRRGRAAADGADPRRGHRGRARRRVAGRRPGAARRRGLADGRREPSSDPAPERVGPADRGDGPGVSGRPGGRAAGRAGRAQTARAIPSRRRTRN